MAGRSPDEAAGAPPGDSGAAPAWAPPQEAGHRLDRHFSTDHLQKDLRSRSVRGAALTLATRFARSGMQVVSLVVLARLLSPEDFGLFGKVIALTGFLVLMRNLGLTAATIQRERIGHQQVTNLFWFNAAIGTLMALAVAAGAPLFAWFYGDPQVTGVTRGLALSIFFGGLQMQHMAILQRQMRYGAVARIELVSMALGIGAGIAAAAAGWGYWSLVVLHVVNQAASAVGATVASGWLPGLPRTGAGTRSLLTFGGNLMGFNLLQYVAKHADNVLIGKYVGSIELGHYTRAYQLLLLPVRQIFRPMAAVTVPMLSRAAGDPQRLRRAYLQMLDKFAFLTIPAVALLIATSDWVVAIALGEKWAMAARLFAILGYAALFQAVSDTSDWLLTATGKTDVLFRWGLVRVAFIVAGIVVGLITGGTVGVAWGVAISVVGFVMPLQFWLTGRYTPVSTRDMVVTVAPSAILGVSILGALRLGRLWLPADLHPVAGLALAVPAALFVTGLVALVVPRVRRSLIELVRMRGAFIRGGREGGRAGREPSARAGPEAPGAVREATPVEE